MKPRNPSHPPSPRRIAMAAGGGLLTLAVACEAELPGNVRTPSGVSSSAGAGQANPTPTPDRNPAGSVVDTSGAAAPSPSPTPDLDSRTLAIVPENLALFVPPPDGSAPLFAATASLAAGGAPGAVDWRSSDPGVARVSAGGLVQAGRAGSAVITATSGSQTATASVKVAERGRLEVVSAGALPEGAATLWAQIADSAGHVLFEGAGAADLDRLGDLAVRVVARSAAGVPLAAGRWQGLSLQPGKLNRFAVPLNQPRLDFVQAGGPGAQVLVRGGAFERWLQGGSAAPFAPGASASLGGAGVSLSVLGDSVLLLSIPASLPAGLPATRSLVIEVGGVPLASEFRPVGRLEIQAPPATLSVSAAPGSGFDAVYRYAALAFDPAGTAVPGAAALRWGIVDPGESGEGSSAGSPGGDRADPAGTLAEDGAFTPLRPGTASIAVRSGNVLATATVEVVP